MTNESKTPPAAEVEALIMFFTEASSSTSAVGWKRISERYQRTVSILRALLRDRQSAEAETLRWKAQHDAAQSNLEARIKTVASLEAQLQSAEARSAAGVEAAFRAGWQARGDDPGGDMPDASKAGAAALATLLAAAWQPIATAPKDGTWFVAVQSGSRFPCSWEVEDDGEGTRKEGWYDFFGGSFEEPTHWWPLPTPPAGGADDAG